jgi:hypothetical protein
MRHLSCLGLLALAGLAVTATAARADVFVRVPFIQVYVGSRPAPVVQPAPVAPAPTVVPGDPPPVPVEPVPLPVPRAVTPPTPDVVPALTPAQFASSFRPLPGTYEVVLQHPVTCCPVKVCFTLPSCPRKVKVHRRELVFVCPGHTVVVRFLPNGGVRVRG